MLRYFKTLYVQVLLAITLGILLGHFWPEAGKSLKPLGDGFIRLIKMVIAPVIFCTVVSGIAHMSDMKRFGRVGGKALLYFEVVSTIALVIGILAAQIIGPGRGFGLDASKLDPSIAAKYLERAQKETFADHLLGLIPESFVGAFTGGDLVQVVILAIFTGFAINRLGELGDKVTDGLDTVAKVFFSIIAIVVKFAPLGAFGAMAYTIGAHGLDSLKNLAALIGTFYLVSIFFVIVVLGLIARIVGFSIFRFIAYIREELLVVLGTSSSESVLPQLMEKLERLGASRPVVGLVIPTGYSFNLDGTNIYITLATLFLAQATDTPLSAAQIATLLLVAMLTSKGASGVTGAGFVTLAATLSAVPTIPVASLAVLVGVDRFMSECRALTNTVGNGVATLAVAKWDRELDMNRLQRELAPSTRSV
ncbi:dicarboxylate/amino acid:cation symporter [bacterium]|nr:MAG: dicarboxylate/amino acid:cation symporter [bacterium]